VPTPVALPALLADAAAPPAPTRPAFLSIQRASAKGLFDAYAKNEIAADLEYKDTFVEIAGLISEIRRDTFGHPVVNLQAGRLMQHVRCQFDEEQVSSVVKLEVGQLVALRCTVRGKALGPTADGCTVAWAGPKEKELAVEPDRQAAIIVARSAEKCLGEYTLSRLQDGKFEGKAMDAETLEKFTRMVDNARRDLGKPGMEPLPCDDARLWLTVRCDAQPKLPECESAQVQGWVAAMQR
jgi:hypothetical protein